MTHIEIPFHPDMVRAIEEGRKCATTRSERYGEPGDTFALPGHDFQKYVLIDVFPAKLQGIRDNLYRLEGVDSPEEFEQLWRRLHRGNFLKNKDYFIHFFGAVL